MRFLQFKGFFSSGTNAIFEKKRFMRPAKVARNFEIVIKKIDTMNV